MTVSDNNAAGDAADNQPQALSEQTDTAARSEFLDSLSEGNRAIAEQRGFGSMEEIFGALQKADERISLPDFNDEKQTAEFFTKIGRPEKPEEYKFKLPEGDTGEFAKQIAPILHKAGLSVKQAEILNDGWNSITEAATAAHAAAQEKQEQEYAAVQVSEMEDLKTEWGAKYDKNTEIARQSARQFSVSPEMLQGLERAWGSKAVMNFFFKLGTSVGDDNIISPAGGGNNAINTANPAEAKAKLERLKADPEWRAKFAAGDAKAAQEFAALHKAITGGR